MSISAEHYEWRLQIGPRLARSDDPYYYDWKRLRTENYNSVLTAGSTVTTTSTTIQLNNSTTLPTAGGVWIRPFSSGQKNELVEYVGYTGLSSSQLTGLSRENPVTHTVGSQAVVLWEIQHDDGNLSEARRIDSDLAVSTWSLKASGFRVPSSVTLTGHLCRVQTRHLVGNQWERWTNTWVGVIDQVQKNDDYKRSGKWSITIVPVAEQYGANEVTGVRAGDLDIAQNSTATGTTPLQVAYKEYGSGDFTASNPTFSAQNVLDPDPKKIYITDRYFGGNNKPLDTGGNIWPATANNGSVTIDAFISQAYLNPPQGYVGTRWIEITTLRDIGLVNLRLVIPGPKALSFMVTGSSVAHSEAGDHIILAENRDIFERENPDHEARVVTKMEDRQDGVNIFDCLNPTQGGLALFGLSTGIHNSIVLWGGQAYNQSSGFGANDGYNWGRPWNGPSAASIGVGQTLRYIYNPTGTTTLSGSFWTVDNIHTPGYDLPGHLGSGNIHSPPPHLIFSLPAIGLEVASDVVKGATFVPMRDGSGESSTNGIPYTGTVQIGTEQITYFSKTSEGIYPTAPLSQTHDEGDIVYVLQNGAITDGYPVKTLTLTRTTGGIHPTNMALYVSPHPGGARPPTVGDWENDYDYLTNFSWSGNDATTNIGIPSGSRRARTMVLWLYNSSTEPARQRLAQANFDVDKDDYGGYGWIDDGPAQNLVTEILNMAGMDTSAITVTSDLATLGDTQSAATTAWAVVTDAVQRHLGRMSIARNGQITIGNNDFWTETTFHDSGYTFDETNVVSVRLQSSPARRVKQIELEWEDDAGNSGTQYSPIAAAAFGATKKFGPVRLKSGGYAATIAANLFNIYAYPVQVSVECAGDYAALAAGHVVRVVWDFEDQQQTHDYRYIVVEVEHEIKDGVWRTKFTGQRVDSQEAG